jgi:hypothetical protein
MSSTDQSGVEPLCDSFNNTLLDGDQVRPQAEPPSPRQGEERRYVLYTPSPLLPLPTDEACLSISTTSSTEEHQTGIESLRDSPQNPFLGGYEARLQASSATRSSRQGEQTEIDYVLYISPFPPPFATDELKSNALHSRGKRFVAKRPASYPSSPTPGGRTFQTDDDEDFTIVSTKLDFGPKAKDEETKPP